MLREVRRVEAPRIDAWFSSVNLRSPTLRFGLQRGRNIVSDYTLASRGSPFLDQLSRRIALTLVLEGRGRFDEDGRSGWLAPGDLVISDHTRRGTEAYSGRASTWLVIEWERGAIGAPMSGMFQIESLSRTDRARMIELALAFEADPTTARTIPVFDLLRACGLAFDRIQAGDLAQADPGEQRLTDSVMGSLARLDRLPAIDEVADQLGWNTRTVHRRLERVASRYGMPWRHWRSALHHTRIVQAIRWCAAPNVTTELIARLTGFRSPTSLCHAFADAGLPSPQTLVRAARRDALVHWAPSDVSLDSCAVL